MIYDIKGGGAGGPIGVVGIGEAGGGRGGGSFFLVPKCLVS